MGVVPCCVGRKTTASSRCVSDVGVPASPYVRLPSNQRCENEEIECMSAISHDSAKIFSFRVLSRSSRIIWTTSSAAKSGTSTTTCAPWFASMAITTTPIGVMPPVPINTTRPAMSRRRGGADGCASGWRSWARCSCASSRSSRARSDGPFAHVCTRSSNTKPPISVP